MDQIQRWPKRRTISKRILFDQDMPHPPMLRLPLLSSKEGMAHQEDTHVRPQRKRQTRRPSLCRSVRSHYTKKTPKSIRNENAKPGDRVSADQLEVTTPGLIPQLKGKLMNAKYTCATVYLDEASSKSFVYCQTSRHAEQTLASKNAPEQHYKTFGIEIKAYLADSSRFHEQAFQDSCREAQQDLTLRGVSARHQNSPIERHIRTLSEGFRAMLLHAMLLWRWVTLHPWPYALHHASYLQDGKTRTENFAGTDAQQLELDQLHTFGCPVYVLDGVLQGTLSKLPRYSSRARVSIYIGHSPQHAGNVALILHPSTTPKSRSTSC